MQKLRSHIAKLFVISMIWVGFGLYMARPAQAKSAAQSFSNWLNAYVNESEAPSLQNDLNRLSDSGASVYRLIEHASRVLGQTEAAEGPAPSDASTLQMYRLLLVGWNQFQTGSGMADVPPPQNVKPVSGVQQVDKSGYGHALFVFTNTVTVYSIFECGDSTPLGYRTLHQEPMKSGSAIGAP